MGALPRAALALALAVVLAAPAGATTLSTPTVIAGGGSVEPQNVASGAPYTMAVDAHLVSTAGLFPLGGDVLLADGGGYRVYSFTPNGAIIPIAGTGAAALATSKCQTTTGAFDPLAGPYDVIKFGTDYLISDGPRNEICAVDSTGDARLYAGWDAGYVDDIATNARFHTPTDMDPYGAGFYLADENNKRIRKYNGTFFSTVAGTTVSPQDVAENGTTDATAANIGFAHAVSAISDTDFLLANDSEVFKVAAGKIARVAGGGLGDLVDGANAKDVYLQPGGLQTLQDGGFLVSDSFTGKLVRVTSSGNVFTEVDAGTGGGSIALDNHALYFTDGKYVKQMAATELASGPGEYSGSTTAHFEYASWDKDATFACNLDNLGFSICPGDYPGLAPGKHTLRVEATTDHGTRADTALTRVWKIDLTPPTAFDLQAPDADATLTDPKPTFSWTAATDPGTGTSGSGIDHYDLVIDGNKVATVAAGSCAAACSGAPPDPIADGPHRWQVRAVDAVGNAQPSAERAFTMAVPPVAALTVAPSRALAGRTVSFDASASTDANGGIADYAWDLDGDGSFETDTGAAATTTRTYASPATLTVKVRVTDTGGLTSVAQQTLVISAQAPAGKPLGVSIDDGAQYTNDPKVTIFAVWPSFASDAFVSNDGGFKNGQLFPVAEKIPWTLDSSGPERLPKTIYVRFTAGSQTSETYQDDIILDQTPPKLLSASLTSGGSAATAAVAHTATLKLKATDNVSGVGAVQVTKNKRRPGAFLKYKKALKVVPAKTLYVRVRDRAGNLSTWRAAKRR